MMDAAEERSGDASRTGVGVAQRSRERRHQPGILVIVLDPADDRRGRRVGLERITRYRTPMRPPAVHVHAAHGQLTQQRIGATHGAQHSQ